MQELIARSDGAGIDDALAARITQHLVSVIERTAVDAVPFDHQVLEGPFPASDYPALLAALPADRYFRELGHYDARLPDGRSARLQFPLVDANIRRLPLEQRAFWGAVAHGLTSQQVLSAYRRRFARALTEVTGRAAETIRLRPHATLFRDLGGYKISIHPDSPRKAITTQYYLPADESQVHLGTLFHSRNNDGSYALARAMRFAPNSGYAFAVTPTSFHSVSPMRPDDRPRNSLMVIIQYDRGPLIESFKSARSWLRAAWDQLRGAGSEAGEGRYERM
jgi:hypothetical protein